MQLLMYVVLVVQAIILTTGNPVRCKIDIAFVVDSSRSMSGLGNRKDFIKDIVRRYDVGPKEVQFAAISYSDHVKNEFFFKDNADREGVIKDVDSIVAIPGEAARTYKALERMRTGLFAHSQSSRVDVVRVGIILTDGPTNPGLIDDISLQQAKEETQKEAELARQDGIYLLAVGVGPNVDFAELRGISSDPDSTFMITADSYGELKTDDIIKAVPERACYQAEE